jgi:FlaA1/EpsC-like NDP-sugar epimerase
MPAEKPNNPIWDAAPEDLLPRRETGVDRERVSERVSGKVVLVTGAAGSVGSELCRQIADFRPRLLVGFDQAETPLFYLERELAGKFPSLAFEPRIGSITRADDVNAAMEQHRPAVVFHAAAYKHVSMMERDAFAAVENNIFGTWQFALASAAYGVEYFVLISTDKVVRPASVMGVTKRIAELSMRALQKKKNGTRFIAVRFGNVIGSSGSVVSLFMEQIAAGGPVTVTHPEMRRYFMTASEAGQLVLESLALGKGGEIFVLDMGEPVKIVDLARKLIHLSGLQREQDIKIEFSGARPGEKLFEELNLQDEHLAPTAHLRIRSFRQPVQLGRARIETYLRALRQAAKSRDRARLTQLFEHLIPDYCPALNLPHVLSPSRQGMSFNAVQRPATQSGLSVPVPQMTVTNLT